ncbi:hypothetical protein [Chroococcidiopsis sp. TS-821]|uniref:hypothetical protein n=1 Tax=Chroococcidiopsis sp. TS-821 TaxID=1378066 RepID=UPI0011B0DFC7|nr:hypothetical protein [Chroococcidiopsis sp. TS-821]
MTLEFHLCVTGSDNSYQVSTEKLPPTVPQAKEVRAWDVAHWLSYTEQIKEAVHLGDRHNLNANLVFLGKQLYTALFTGKVAESWHVAQNLAQQKQAVLSLHLEIAASCLVDLPWEFLHTAERFLITDPQIAVKVSRSAAATENQEQYDWALLLDDIQRESLAEQQWNETLLEEIDDSDPDYAEDSAVVANILSQLAASPSTTPSNEPSSRLSTPPPRGKSDVLTALVIGSFMMATVAIASIWWEYQQPNQIASSLASSAWNRLNKRNWQNASSQEITAIAIAQLHQGELSLAQALVEELLNRNALQYADTALKAVPRSANSDRILFLRGRLAWQSSQIEQARRYWEAALKQKPDIKYYNALGFAYYAQDNWSQANEAWFEALYLANQQPLTQDNRELLTTYAGLALVLQHFVPNQPPNEQAKLINEAVKLREKVLAEDPVNFQPQQLERHWLWHQKAVADWRSLLLLNK